MVTPPADHYEGAVWNGFTGIRARLDDNIATTLNDLLGIGITLPVGDITWAYQWDQTIGVGGAFLISKDKHMSVVPEPATLLFLGAGLLGVGLASRRRKKA